MLKSIPISAAVTEGNVEKRASIMFALPQIYLILAKPKVIVKSESNEVVL